MACNFNIHHFRSRRILINTEKKTNNLIRLFYPLTTLVLSFFFLGVIASANYAFGKSTCGNSFENFLIELKKEAISKGYKKEVVDSFLEEAVRDPKVLEADRSQTIFRKSFFEFSRAVISTHRLQHAAINERRFKEAFKNIHMVYGVPKEILLTFWALETDFGLFQGEYNTLNSLLTLSHDCRRPNLFRPQVFGALELYTRKSFDPRTTKGAWAGEVGMLQMLPLDILKHGVDGDNDGKIDISASAIDALYSTAKKLVTMGWKRDEPWLLEVRVPENMDWLKTGLNTTLPLKEWEGMGVWPRLGKFQNFEKVSLVIPMGRKGPAFLTYPNFRVLSEWNNSSIYIITAAYFATLLNGEPRYRLGSPEPILNLTDMLLLQKKLEQKGYDVGGVDGILGAKTRKAVKQEQIKMRIPADGWPTKSLLNKI